MNMRTLINPAMVAAGLLLGMTTAVQADSGHISVILHDDGNTYDLGYGYGYGYGGCGYCDYGHHHRHHDNGHHYGHHKKQHWHHDRHHEKRVHHYSRHDGYRGAHGKGGHPDSRREQRRHRS